MPNVVGIQFKGMGRIYFFDPLNIEFVPGEYAIVETVRGLELGKVIIGNHIIDDNKLTTELKPITRKANKNDVEQDEQNVEISKKAFDSFKNHVNSLSLEMKPLYAEYTIDRSKVIFYYTADDRVDFRELLKLLTPEFKCRVELRQIGPREAARYIGGLGSCGQELCCKSHLRDFDVVTMKMAKDQSMSLNTSKISGACGKLMCCIAYENELYQLLKEEVPSVGTYVKTPTSNYCKVIAVDYIKKTVRTLESSDAMPVTHKASDVVVIERRKEQQ